MSVPHGGIAAMTTERHTPPHIADARTMLENWLDFHRATLTPKAEGLTPEQLCTAWAPPSTLTLQGLMHHMADVERHWFRRVLAAEELPGIYGTYDGAFDVSPDMSFADARTTWEAEIAIARKNCAEHSLDDTRPFPHGGEVSLRWIYQPHDHRVRPPLWARGPHPGADRRHHRSVTGLSRACRR